MGTVEYLPRPALTPQATPAAPPASLPILLVDDHRDVRDAFAALLEASPDLRLVGQAWDGQRAVLMICALRPDVVVMDVMMEGMNGIEAIRTIHAEHPEIAVIALSMHDHLEPIVCDAGAVACMDKTASADEFLAVIRRYGPLCIRRCARLRRRKGTRPFLTA